MKHVKNASPTIADKLPPQLTRSDSCRTWISNKCLIDCMEHWSSYVSIDLLYIALPCQFSFNKKVPELICLLTADESAFTANKVQHKAVNIDTL